MRRLIVVVLVLGAGVALAGPGKIVRIERPRAATVPHLCGLFKEQAMNQMICIGPPPVVDERIALIDTRRAGLLGELRVDAVADSTEFQMCPKTMYKVTGSPSGVSAAQLNDIATVYGVRGIRVDPRARIVRNAEPPREDVSVAIALDLDEDGASDVMITQYACDATGNPTSITSSGRARICFDSYLRRGHQLERVAQDVLQQCQ